MRTVSIDYVQIKVHEHRAYQFEPWEWCQTRVLFPMLMPGMVVYDIGAEEGELTAAVAKVVGGNNVHIIEPSKLYWPNIKSVWDANDLGNPGGCWQGFASDVSRWESTALTIGGWPPIEGPIQMEGAFCFVDERPDIPSITIDDYARISCTHPDVILMDIEGAEVLALRGARETLGKGTTLFVSVHNETALAKYGTAEAELFELMLDYHGVYLGYDHEQHWRFDRNV